MDISFFSKFLGKEVFSVLAFPLEILKHGMKCMHTSHGYLASLLGVPACVNVGLRTVV